jgi:chemotaxis family two-component system sensor kinase Cph1
MPRWMCGGWDDALVNVNIAANFIIFLSYISISINSFLLWSLVHNKLSKTWIVVAFSLFVGACGITHLNDVIVFWWAPYRFFTVCDAITAAFSAATALALPMVVKYIKSLPSAQEMADLAARQEKMLDTITEEYREKERLRIDTMNANHHLKSMLSILENRLASESDYEARMQNLRDVREIILSISEEKGPQS